MREGWIKSHRKVTESDIWNMPPVYFKVWKYLLYAANFEEKTIPMRDGSSIKLGRGQHLTSIRTIASKVGWYERGIEKTPNPKTITDILEWMTSQDMIHIENGNHDKQYTLVTITNWDKYQADFVNVSINSDITGQQSPDIKNNDNNFNNAKAMNKQEEEKEEKEEKEGQLNCTDEFEVFWDHYPRKIDKSKAYDSFTLCISKGIGSEDLIKSAQGYNRYCSMNKIGERYIKYAHNFLAGTGSGRGSGSGNGSVNVNSNSGGGGNSNSSGSGTSDKFYEEFINYVPAINSCNQYSENVAKALQLQENPGLENGSLW